VGDGRDEGTDVGPLSNRRRLDATRALIDDAVGKGAKIRTGGAPPPSLRRGFFFQPTVISDVNASMRVMTEEPFGPVAPIASFKTLEDALERANATEYGLAGYVFTRDAKTAFLASEGLEVGMVGVNGLVIATAEAPFGGVKASGFGREGGSEGVEGYTTTKYINMSLK
jgi:succinate-semialdehyde dehydrogenase/glutarate-semialdehyde dehydrogenase